MKNLFLEAQDVWLFRDGRPFDAGSAHRAESLFPAHPFTIQVAIRSHHLVLKKVDFNDREAVKKEVGEPLTFPGKQSLKGLTLSGTFVARRIPNSDSVELLFPLPADAYWKADKSVQSSVLDGGRLLPGADAEKPHGTRWLTQSDLLEYLAGKPVHGIPQSEVFERENRFGIGRNAAWVTEQGLLYEVDFIRPRVGVGLLVHMDGYEDPGWQNGLLQLGGEGRAALYSQVKVSSWPNLPSPLPARFKIYLATPAYFSGGSQSANWGQFFDGEVKLLATAIRGYETMGGFDWVKDPESHEAHRASRRYVPAGSVYYFENLKDAKLKADSLTEYGAEIGFGRFIVSPVKER
jgi:CRISPR-associated protein Cmr3